MSQTKTYPNLTNWKRVRDSIARAGQFDMSQYSFGENGDLDLQEDDNVCGTPACIAGHAFIHTLMEDEGVSYEQACRELHWSTSAAIARIARDYLGIEYLTATILFAGFYRPDEYGVGPRADKEEVLAMMDRVLAGEAIEDIIYIPGCDEVSQ